MRRGALLDRKANMLATSQYPLILNAAHDVAMAGATWTWEKDKSDTTRMCALLAGVAILLASKEQHAVRKEDAFQGRVQLPFLETLPPRPGVRRIALLPSKNEWIVYSVSAAGKPTVQFRHRGFEGLSQAVLLFTSAEKRV